jgi:hypothetical protein
VIRSPYAERLKADGKWMVTISACGANPAWLFEYGTTFAESLFTIAHRDELQWRVRYDPTNYGLPALCFPSLFNCAQFSPSTTDRLILMAVIWIDEFEDGRMDSSIGITLYEQQKIQPIERAIKPEVYERLWQELVLLWEKRCRSQ